MMRRRDDDDSDAVGVMANFEDGQPISSVFFRTPSLGRHHHSAVDGLMDERR
jgi:hypothetical protein